MIFYQQFRFTTKYLEYSYRLFIQQEWHTKLKLLKLKYILIINMKHKNVGAISRTNNRTIGKLYTPNNAHTSNHSAHNTPKRAKQQHDYPTRLSSNKDSRLSTNKRRSSSVGKIYNSQPSNDKDSKQPLRRNYNNLIDYEQMENKLSNYLACTIRTNSRQKYNYLSQHCVPSALQSQQFLSKLRCENAAQNRRNPLQFVTVDSNNHFKDIKSNFGLKYEQQNCNQNQNEFPVSKKSNNRQPFSQQNKQNFNIAATVNRKEKEGNFTVFSMNHQQSKSQLQNKLKQIIENYESKNKELNFQMQKLETKLNVQNKAPPQPLSQPLSLTQPQSVGQQQKATESLKEIQKQQYSEAFLNETFQKLVEFNLKAICLVNQCDPKLEELWRAIHGQIIVDERLRSAKIFITENNASTVLEFININRLKKLEGSALKSHSEQYDPFAVEKFGQLFKANNPNSNTKLSAKWVAENFVRCYDEAERHWLKHLSQERTECLIKRMILQRQISGLRKEGGRNQVGLREFTRLISTLLKANLRNRDVYQIYSKLRGSSYIDRLIELLEERAGKGSEAKSVKASK